MSMCRKSTKWSWYPNIYEKYLLGDGMTPRGTEFDFDFESFYKDKK